MSEHTLVVCSQCNSINRLPNDKLTAGGKCGVCHLPLFSGQPAELTNTNFQRFTQKNQLPVVIDYWAPWCGPCKMMAPVFASVTQQMEPYVRFAKVNTETEQALAAPSAVVANTSSVGISPVTPGVPFTLAKSLAHKQT